MQTSFARQTKTNLKMQIALFFAERLKKPECVLEVEIELTLKFQGSDASLFTNILVAWHATLQAACKLRTRNSIRGFVRPLIRRSIGALGRRSIEISWNVEKRAFGYILCMLVCRVGVRVWIGDGCPCPPVRNDIVTPLHLFFHFHVSWSISGLTSKRPFSFYS